MNIDARRERYALAISRLDGWREEHVADHGQRPKYLKYADAVLALVDAEMATFDATGVWLIQSLSEKEQELKAADALTQQLRADLAQVIDAHLLMVKAQELTIPPHFRSRAQHSGGR